MNLKETIATKTIKKAKKMLSPLEFTLLPIQESLDEGRVSAKEHPLLAVIGAPVYRESYCDSWSSSLYELEPDSQAVACVFRSGNQDWITTDGHRVTVRLALSAEEAVKILPENANMNDVKNGKSFETNYEYVSSKDYALTKQAAEFEKLYQSGNFEKTGKTYTFYNSKKRELEDHDELKAPDGTKWVRFEGIPFNKNSKFPNGKAVKTGTVYYFQVKKVKAHRRKNGKYVLDNVRFTAPIDPSQDTYDGDFNNSWIKKVLFPTVSLQMLPTKQYLQYMREQSLNNSQVLSFDQVNYGKINSSDYTINGENTHSEPLTVRSKHRDITITISPYQNNG